MKAEYRLAALDMDGTLLNSQHAPTPYTCDVLRRASVAGRVMVLCTGRCLSEFSYLLPQLSGVAYAISVNGARLYDLRTLKAVVSHDIADADAAWILRESSRYDTCRQIVLGDQSYHDFGGDAMLSHFHMSAYGRIFESGSIRTDDLLAVHGAHPGCTAKVNVFFHDADEKRRFEADVRRRAVTVCDAVTLGLEISPRGATKAQGLRALCERLNIPIEQAMAIGDGGNDLEVMRAAGFSVAMGNAIDEVRAIAHAVTDDCDHDGAAKAIERFMNV